ncbi:pyridoxal phosphate-dependent aminotransferase [Streptomyces sp. NPDC058674]|uniref:pyridoxal phosphate-dependent aminotransferase n=1 Tax=Streptomyces sp. NPDC058674 TaxID=3346592 RepID=UPI00365B99E3
MTGHRQHPQHPQHRPGSGSGSRGGAPAAPAVPARRGRLAAHGHNVFAEMSALAERHGAVNLGQGFPDTAGPDSVVEAAVRALRAGHHQYPPVPGLPGLRRAIADHQRRRYGLDIDPDRETVVTTGASEALAAALLALTSPGDEIVALEPFYDSYAACATLAGTTLVPVRLRAPDFTLDTRALAAAITGRTRVLLLNTPHNPTGAVLTPGQLHEVAALARAHDLLVISDEVYEHLVFEGVHQPIATLPGMFERTVTVSSAGKSFSFTGWKVGWASGPADLVTAVREVKQHLSFAGGTPFQYAVADALRLPEEYFTAATDSLRRRRDLMTDGLSALGFEVRPPQGTYFITADITPLGERDGMEFCRALPGRCGVAAIPQQVFYADPDAGQRYVRFAFCKRESVLHQALDRLKEGLA